MLKKEKINLQRTITVIASLYSFTLWINFLYISNSKTFPGGTDLSGLPVESSGSELFFTACLNQFFILFSVLIYHLLVPRHEVRLGKYTVIINKNRFSCFFFIVLISSSVFFFLTGVGKVYSAATHPLKPLFLLLDPANFFIFYYILTRENKNTLFIVNVILYSFFQILKGWTSFILFIGLMEIYFFICKKSANRLLKFPFLYSIFFPLVILLAGGLLYKHLYAIKNEIRGVILTDSISYAEGISLLASRLSTYTMDAGIESRLEQVVEKVNAEGEFSEIKSFLYFLHYFIPGINTEARPISNASLLAFYPNFGPKYSNVEMNIFTYYSILLRVSFLEATLIFIITFFMLFLIILLYKFLFRNSHINLLMFFMIFFFLQTFPSPVYFIRPYMVFILALPLLCLFRVISFKKTITDKI